MQRSFSLIAKATGVAAVCLLVYRGVQLYTKNDITVYITEVVHLPDTAAQRPRRLQHDPDFTLDVEGKVEMEACVMESYRFSLKLVGHVRSALFLEANKLPASVSPRSTPRRVLAVQTSSTAFAGSGGGNNSNSSPNGGGGDDDSFSNASGSRRHGPALVITYVDPIVDAYETDATSTLAFTPACISEGLLGRYICTVGNAGSADGHHRRSNNSSMIANDGAVAATASPLSPQLSSGNSNSNNNGVGNIYVRSCFLESDGSTAYGRRLTIELEFVRPVFGARVLIRLPSKRCQILHCNAGTVGRVTQLLNQPRKCVWDIGEVSEEMCVVASAESTGDGDKKKSRAVDDMPGAALPAVAAASGGPSFARLEFVFEQPPPGVSLGEEDAAADNESSDESDEDDDNNRFNSTASSVKSSTLRRRFQSSTNSNGGSGRRFSSGTVGSDGGPSSPAASAGSLALAETSSGQSSRARKREERARKAREKALRIQEGGADAGGVRVPEAAPYVELLYSVNQLISGTAVKRLQVVQESPNWVPRTRLDRHLLKPLFPSLGKMKLKKFAHYTTWLVQPVTVSQL